MFNKILPIALYKIRSSITNLKLSPVVKLNQFAMHHVARSFGKDDLIVQDGILQPQIYGLNVMDNVEAIAKLYNLNNEQKELTQTFLHGLYSAFHDDETLCPDYIDHWKEAGIEIDAFNGGEKAVTYEQIVGAEDPHATIRKDIDRAMQGGLGELLGRLFGNRMGVDSAVVDLPKDRKIKNEPLYDAETKFLIGIDAISHKHMSKICDMLFDGDYKAYLKYMAKKGFPTKYIRMKNGKVKIKKFDTVNTTPQVPQEPKDKFTEILSHTTDARTPIEEIIKMDEYFTQHGIVYEHPLCFDKAMGKLLHQRSNNLITAEAMKGEVTKLLENFLGKELASNVFLQDNEEGFAMGINGNGVGAMMLKQEIAMRLINTKLLN